MNVLTDISQLKVDKSYKLFFNEHNINNKIFEVRAFIDEDFIVTKACLRESERWIYEIDHIYLFKLYVEKGFIFACGDEDTKK